jgi:hypothetical protein
MLRDMSWRTIHSDTNGCSFSCDEYNASVTGDPRANCARRSNAPEISEAQTLTVANIDVNLLQGKISGGLWVGIRIESSAGICHEIIG